MNLLLDTHVALWAISKTSSLDADTKQSLVDPDNTVFYSIASVWEIAIKHQLYTGNMPISEEEFVSLCDESGFVQLPIQPAHIYAVKSLSRPRTAPKHNDPFDRLLIAQAKVEKMQLITSDGLLPDYGESCVVKI